jgi:hypothetical protein
MSGDILLQAHDLINGERQDAYGSPVPFFTRTAALWSAYLGHAVAGKDVAVCMCLLKLAREANHHKHDNLLDAAGYIGLAADLEDTKC